jgi:hypothetical protein
MVQPEEIERKGKPFEPPQDRRMIRTHTTIGRAIQGFEQQMHCHVGAPDIVLNVDRGNSGIGKEDVSCCRVALEQGHPQSV